MVENIPGEQLQAQNYLASNILNPWYKRNIHGGKHPISRINAMMKYDMNRISKKENKILKFNTNTMHIPKPVL